MESFAYANPKTLHEALALLGPTWDDAAPLAGGTDLLNCMKDYVWSPKRVVNIKNLRELSGIRNTPQGLHIGALTTFDDLMQNPVVRQQYPAIMAALQGVSSMQMRNMGTVGGDLCIRPRDWYYRAGYGVLALGPDGKSLVPNGENRYAAIFGSGPAYFVSSSSLGPVFATLGATIKVVGAKGSRDVAADQFFVAPKSNTEREIVLQPDELVQEIIIPPAAGMKNATYEVRHREVMADWPLATATVALKMQGNSVSSAKVRLGQVAPTPWAATAAEQMLAGKTITPEVAEQAGKAAVQGATPLSQNAYKVQLASVAVKRALLAAAGLA